MSIKSKTAIVTGAAKGIGYAISKRYLEEGMNVILADQDDKAGQEAVETLSQVAKHNDGKLHFIHCDVSEPLDVHNLIAASIDEFSKIDVLVNNAGIVASSNFLDLDEATFDKVLAVNLKGSFLCGQAVARHMVENIKAGDEPGAIINMSSVNAVFAIGDQVPYSISKGGVNQLTKVMAQSLAPHGIRVNAIGPGSIMTEMLSAVADNPEAKQKILSRTPMGRIGDPEEIASIAVFLASQEASYITGQTIYADGGRLGLNYTVPVKDD
jgi:NAD(P)-dependent dehydrogenase (short-subunit alcohol dehydrogenase family)